MIRLTQLKLNIKHTEEELIKKAAQSLKLSPADILEYQIIKKSIDARKKNEIYYIYTLDLNVKGEKKVLKTIKNPNISIAKKESYHFVQNGEEKLLHRPVVIGAGPAGLFCALELAEHGYAPLVLERGYDVEKRAHTVEDFWNTGELDPECNVQFGEGGAGTFSDGKLNTLVKDISGRNYKVLKTFVEFGAPSGILFLNKPHIGTDYLKVIVKRMRKHIIELGGEFRFGTKVTSIKIEGQSVAGVTVQDVKTQKTEDISCNVAILAIGHSARDTFAMLNENKIVMIRKAFAIGVRIEHPQNLISENQYGSFYKDLPAADYKLTCRAKDGRGVYSFCMCPGGFVVNASSEKEYLAVNGMSNHDRGGRNANSALIVTINPSDFDGGSVLSGVEFQRKWENLAYKEGKGCIPVQLFGDFLNKRESTAFGTIHPDIKGAAAFGNLRNCLPEYVSGALAEGIKEFDKRIHGFSSEDAVLSGVETRTSSPIRIVRDENYVSNICGLYPSGEGAGYAGGIMSAAMDGIKTAEAVALKYAPYSRI